MFAWLKPMIRHLRSCFGARAEHREPSTLGSSEPLPPKPNPPKPSPLSGDWGPFQPPRDPFSRTREPRPRRPYDRGGAFAVAEPDEDEMLAAIGASDTTRKSRARQGYERHHALHGSALLFDPERRP
jgi:hypothetical protein